VIQITDFCLSGLGEPRGDQGAKADAGSFSGERWKPEADIQAFAMLFSQIAVGTSAEQGRRGRNLPSFVYGIIERGQSADSTVSESFVDIFEVLKQHELKIMEAIEIGEVSDLVNWIQESEKLAG
jgi:hypothetical protein